VNPWRRVAPVVVLVLACGLLMASRGNDGRPSPRDDEVFLQAAYLMRTKHVTRIEAVTEAAGIQFGWTGDIAKRLRTEGDIQTYFLLEGWRHASDFRVKPSPYGRPLYVESGAISRLTQLWFVLSVFLLYWAVVPLGRGVALASALLYCFGHPFRHGPALFDPWMMPAAVAAIGCWLRDRHRTAAALAFAAVIIKPNYLFLLPAFCLASLVRPGTGDPDGTTGVGPAAVHAVTTGVVIAVYLALAAAHVIYLKGYAEGVRSGYDPGLLAYSLVETLSFRYRAGTLQLRHHWPIYPWTLLNLAALGVLAERAVRRIRLPRTAALLGGLILIPAIANFTVIASIHDYENGGHFRWINVSIIGMAIALPVAYREVARLIAARTTRPGAPRALAAAPSR
jgi:hypothetical protein